jgi:hypothetical protein
MHNCRDVNDPDFLLIPLGAFFAEKVSKYDQI